MTRFEIRNSNESVLIIDKDTFDNCTPYQKIIYMKELFKDYLRNRLCDGVNNVTSSNLAILVDSIPVELMVNLSDPASKYILAKFMYNKILYNNNRKRSYEYFYEESFKFEYIYAIVCDFVDKNDFSPAKDSCMI